MINHTMESSSVPSANGFGRHQRRIGGSGKSAVTAQIPPLLIYR